jgi:type IX secretion system PorP/SprF family membrane protein
MKKIILSALVLLTFQYVCVSQNDIQFSHYMFNELTFNPAMAGNTAKLDASAVVRKQWMGFDRAPMTELLNVNSYIEQISGGAGLTIINDKLGYENYLNAKLSYAYQIKIKDQNRLALGLGFGVLSTSVKGADLTYEDAGDEYAVTTNTNKLRPDFDFGVAYNSPKLSLGLSSTHITQSLKKSEILKVPRHYYFYTKYKINVSDKIDLIESLEIKNSIFITQFDISTIGMYDKKYWAGLAYRLNDAYTIMLGGTITKEIKIGYAYDANCGALRKHSGGSHEIMLFTSFDVFKTSNEHPSFYN